MNETPAAADAHKNCPAVRIPMFPRDTNGTGTNIHGGVILRHMDEAGAIASRAVTRKRVVTVSFDKVVFKKPVHIGDVLTCWVEVTRIGHSSITTKIIVEAERQGVFIPVTEGEAVYVAVDENDRPVPVFDEGEDANAPGAACTSCRPPSASPPVAKNKSTKKDSKKAKRKKSKKR